MKNESDLSREDPRVSDSHTNMSEQERLDAIALKNQQDFLERLKRTPGPQQALEEVNTMNTI